MDNKKADYAGGGGAGGAYQTPHNARTTPDNDNTGNSAESNIRVPSANQRDDPTNGQFTKGQTYKLSAQYLAGLYEYYGREWGWTADAVDGRLSPNQRNFYYDQYLEVRREQSDELTLSIIRAWGTVHAGKTIVSPFISQRYRGLDAIKTSTRGVFPHDVYYFDQETVQKLIELSKPFYFSEFAFLRLTQKSLPSKILSGIMPLKGLRCFEDEIHMQLRSRLNADDYAKYSGLILQYCADFPKLSTVLWDYERAEAHLQTQDVLLRRASASDTLWNAWKIVQKKEKRMTEKQMRSQIDYYNLGINLTPPMWMQHISHQKNQPVDQLWQQEIEKQGYNVQELRRLHYDLAKKQF